jgi:vacuolar-type H+-ATPase subunit H
MTAFDDILTTEAEAAQSIEVAHTAAATAIAEARAQGQIRVASITQELQEESKKKLAAHEKDVSGATDKITAEVSSKITAIEKKFDTHAAELKEDLKKRFA